MADSTINGLSSGSTPLAGTEEVPIWQSSATVKVTTQDIADLAGGDNIGNADLTIDSSGARKLILGGALSTDYFSIRNSADTADFFKVNGVGAVQGGNGSNVQYDFDGNGYTFHKGLNSFTNGVAKTWYNNVGVNTGSTDWYSINGFNTVRVYGNFASSYVDGKIGLFRNTTEQCYIQASSTGGDVSGFDNYYLNTGTNKMHLGGALSTDYFSIRNSGDTQDFFKVQGDGNVRFLASSKNVYFGQGGSRIGTPTSGNSLAVQFDLYNCKLSNGLNANSQIISSVENLNIGYIQQGDGTHYAAFFNGTAPTSAGANACKIYSADESAGNACLHTISEGGDVVKLYKDVQAALANTPNTGDANTDALITALKNVLINTGLGASA